MTNREVYLQELNNIFKKCLDIAVAKNSDYATEDDPFANFKLCELIANMPTEDGIFIRMLDKVSRIGQLLHKEAEVTDEKLEDTLSDLINYTAIISVYLNNKTPIV